MSSKQAMAREEVDVQVPDLPPPPSYQDAHESHGDFAGSSSTSVPQVPQPTPSSVSVPSPQSFPSSQRTLSYSPTPAQHHYTVAEVPNHSQSSDDKREFNTASEFYPPGPANQLQRQSSANAYSPAPSLNNNRRDSQYSNFNTYGNGMNGMSAIPEQGVQRPPMSPTITTYEPKATMPMVADIKNVLDKPKYPNGEREWSYGMCSCCCENFWTCCFACMCPCVVYAKIKSRVSFLERNNYPHPAGGNGCTSDCFIHGCLTSLLGIGCLLQIGNRSTIRDRYRITGSGCSDMMTSWCCHACALTQESREVSLEERALNVGEKSMRLD